MAKVLIIIGSKTDQDVMEESGRYLDWFGIESELIVASAHRDPDRVTQLAKSAEKEGYHCVIAAAGMSSALPGVVAAHTSLPVLGVPLEGGLLGGIDSLYSTVQMPAGIPVGTLAVGKAGARNAAVLSARIIALGDTAVRKQLDLFREQSYKI